MLVDYNKPDPGLELGTTVWKTTALPVKLIGRNSWFPYLTANNGLPAPTTTYNDHWSSVGHIYSLKSMRYPTPTPFITIGRLSKFQLSELINDR